MARRKKKEADLNPEPVVEPVVEKPKVEPEMVVEPKPEKQVRYFIPDGRKAQCAKNRVLVPGDEVFPDDLPGGLETLEEYVEKGLLEKRWV